MKRGLILAAVLAVAASSLYATPLIWRGAGVLKPLSLQAYLGTGYLQTARWDSSGSWIELPEASKTTVIKLFPAVMFSPFKNLEVGAVAPVFSKSNEAASSFGIGDAWIKARYGLLQAKMSPVKLTFSAAAILPTAPEDAKPSLGDRTLDLGFGLVAQTMKFAGFVGHARAGYWLNGKKTVGEVKKTQGNMLEYIAKVDYVFGSRASMFLTVAGTMQAAGDGNAQTTRHGLSVGAVLKPLPVVKLAVRPKLILPLEALSKGGSINPWEAGLDFWLTLP